MILSTKFDLKELDLFLFFLFISIVLVSTSRIGNEGIKCIDREREALLKFKNELIDNCGRLSTWGSEQQKKDCCKWTGIRCNNETNHVVSLNLRAPLDPKYNYPVPARCLRGKISHSLLELSEIIYLDLSNNDFNRDIPKFVGSFNKLKHLNLSNSNFVDSIPPYLGNLSMLKVLDLSGNVLYANDLDWLSGFHSLQHLDLSDVNLEKVVTWLKPIDKLTQLKKLYLSGCGVQETLLTTSFPLASNESANSLMLLDLSFNMQLNISTFLWFLNFSSNYKYIDFSYSLFKITIPDALTTLTSLSHLDLSNCNHIGSIPVTLGNMTSLAYLDLSKNNLQGRFPRSGNLSKLVSLTMSGNKLEGDLKYMNDFLGASTMLEHLDLSFNKLHGSIPSLSRFPSLNLLILGGNQLNGSFTDSILTLPYLANLDVALNRLTGSIPNLASCSSLETLDLRGNKFNGTLTETIGYLSKLQKLDLYSNDFDGVVSEAHLFNLSSLQILDLSYNSNLKIRISSDWNPPFQLLFVDLANCTLGPSFPKWIQNQTQMEHLDISSSKIFDLVPRLFWDNAHSLKSLNMSFNHIYGVIPHFVLSASSLDLTSNEFNGSLPLLLPLIEDDIPSDKYPLQDAYAMKLSKNKFSGEVNEFCNHTFGHLELLDLSDNKLSGELSEECFMKLMVIEIVNLGNNNLSGEIPNPNIPYCSLRSLHLRNNSFEGHFPVLLRDCNLRIIDIGYNSFTGEIPTWLGESFSQVSIVSLRSNKFSGTLPSSLCFLANVNILDISVNDISGTIPRCLNNFTSMCIEPTSLNHDEEPIHQYYDTAYITWKGHETLFEKILWMVKAIDLSSNKLGGEIPREITSLRGLMALNLSRNHLVGSIPRGIDKLELLNFLDLSENNLSGSIPTTLSELDHLGVLNLSFNNLSGKIPWNTHLETFGPNVFSGNPQLCGPPLLKLCPGDQVPQIPKSIINNYSEDNVHTYITKGFYVSMTIGFILAFLGTFGILNFNETYRIKFSKLLMALEDWWFVKIELNKRRLQMYFQNQ